MIAVMYNGHGHIRYVLSGILILMASGSFAQNHWNISAFGGPNLPIIDEHAISTNEIKTELGSTIGMDAFYRFGEKHHVGLSVSSTHVVYTITYNFKARNPGDPKVSKLTNYDVNYSEVALFYRYHHAWTKKLHVILTPALCSTHTMNQHEETIFEDGHSEPTSSLRPFNFAVQMGVGLTYDVSSSWFVMLDARYRFFAMPYDRLSVAMNTQLAPVVGVGYTFN